MNTPRPKEVVERAIEAAERRDFDAFWQNYSKKVRRAIGAIRVEASLGGPARVAAFQGMKVVGEHIEGDRAVVDVEHPTIDAVLLRREDGAWVIVGQRQGGRDVDVERQLEKAAAFVGAPAEELGQLGALLGDVADVVASALKKAASHLVIEPPRKE